MREPANIIRADFGGTLLETRGLTYRADGTRFVDDVSLRLREGRITTILGPNGAGKSLLLRLIHGLIAPTSGDVIWNGRTLDAPARAAQAMVFQRPVMMRRSVAGNLRFALKVKGVPRNARAAQVEALLTKAGLQDMATRPARLLSGGEQQKLAIVRATIGAPRMLMLDEPTANLDPSATRAVETLVQDVQAQGTTVVMVTHDQGQAKRLAQDVAFLQSGRLAEAGPAARLLTEPQSRPMKAWLGGELYVD
ncbi:ATP-binding cassette domain-containing protein [Nereida sp.]|uniref:ATP-binding cassette domain-containing protein n=1 Tax=Nereida sp. TaxID=2736090 RepID=UPI003F6A3032